MANYSQATINASQRRLGRLLEMILNGKVINSADEVKALLYPLSRDPSEFIQDMFFTDVTVYHMSNDVWTLRTVITWKLGIKRQEFVTTIDYNIKTMSVKLVEEVGALVGSHDEEVPDSLEDDDPEFDLIGKSS